MRSPRQSTLLPTVLMVVLALTSTLISSGSADAKGPANFMIRANIKGKVIEGQPLTWTDTQMLLLGRDGALHDFHPKAAKGAKKTAKRFVSYTSEDMVTLLQREFDRSYEVRRTSHFVVVHPRGPWGAWAERLENLYRSFTHYMSVRGFSIRRPQTPLVAVVFRNQQDYYRHAAEGGTPLRPGTLGHYSPVTNRIYLYDIAESAGDASWAANAETIIHEATHQTAYNTGVHRRFADQPRWLVEGLAMMFEAPGVWASSSTQSGSARLNRDRLSDFRETNDGKPSQWVMRLIASDQEFSRNPTSAYAAAWTLSFYLCETQPQAYTKYLARVAARSCFTQYPSRERISDFMGIFGDDLQLLDAQVQRFVSELP